MMEMHPSWIIAIIAIATVLVNLGVNIATLHAISKKVDDLSDAQRLMNEKMFNHDARIAVIESRLVMGLTANKGG